MIRYPGGKAKLAEKILSRFPVYYADGASLSAVTDYGEPFFGGGAIGLEVMRSLAASVRVWINDLDAGIHALWKAIADKDMSEKLIEKISVYKPEHRRILPLEAASVA